MGDFIQRHCWIISLSRFLFVVVDQFMIYTSLIQKAIRFSIKTHEVYQHQKRKGKDIPYSHESLLLKSADILSNASELLDDHEKIGDTVFDRFNAPKEKILKNYLVTITAILARWPESPLAEDLLGLAGNLQMLGAMYFMMNFSSLKIEYSDYDENAVLECPVCNWKGAPKEINTMEYYDDLFDVSCPNCDKMLLVVSYPLVEKG